MVQKSFKVYNSKLLLFGEYLLLFGASALAIPLPKYYLYIDNQVGDNHFNFDDLFNYINSKNIFKLNINKYNEYKNTKSIISNIPIGSGLGSSGAIVAMFYNEFILNKQKSSDIVSLKNDLSIIESFFHSKSSGIDPLCSFLDANIIIQKNTITENKNIFENLINFELINSNIERNNSKSIIHFTNYLTQNIPSDELNTMIEINNILVKKTCENISITREMKKLSSLQLTHFKQLIPESLISKWENGLKSDNYYLKICGAGNGGYFLKYNNY